MMNVQRLLNLSSRTISENSTTILSGAGVIGVIATAVLAVRATPKACEIIAELNEEAEDETELENVIPVSRIDVFKATWKLYIPAGVTGLATIACIVSSNHIGLKRNAAMIGAYAVLDTAFQEYKEEVVKVIGENKARGVDDAVAERKLRNMPVHDGQVIITGAGDQLCLETLSGRYFKSTVEQIRHLENEFNRHIVRDIMYDSLNEWFLLLGLEPTDLGDVLGFNVDKPVDTIFTGGIATNGEPCIVVGYKYRPSADYGKL